MKLKFLGTGGGRYVTGMQKRKTAGILVETDKTKIHIDPGPGAMVHANEETEPENTEAVIVSHGHLDHSNDAQAVIEMITDAYENPGAVFANKTCLEGYGDIEKWISDFHQKKCARVEEMNEGSSFEFRDVEIESQEMFHSDPRTQGFTLKTEEKKTGFWTDTEFSEELVSFYEGCDTLVVYCTRPRGAGIESHTSVSDVPKIVEDLDISTVIITHFGFKFLQEDLNEQKEWLDEEIEPKVVFAEDGMEFPGNRSLGDF